MRFSQCGNLLFVFLGLESRLCGAVFFSSHVFQMRRRRGALIEFLKHDF